MSVAADAAAAAEDEEDEEEMAEGANGAEDNANPRRALNSFSGDGGRGENVSPGGKEKKNRRMSA